MAEANTNNKIGILAKAQKQLSRTKTKVLQNLGKAEKTTDDVFKDHVQKTERQQEVAQHLQKELKTYSHCVKDLSLACKNLQNALSETYEPEWKGESKFKSQLQAFELLWNDYLQKLQDNVINPMNAYLQSFPVLKTKVSKRGRKLVDFDNSRHNLEVLQAAKRRDDAKISKAQDELKDVKRIFDELNNELHTELPEFYDSRVTFYADLYSKFFDAEYTLHTEVGKTCDSIQEIAQSLGKDFEHYKYKPKRPTSVTDAGSVNGETPITASPSLRSSNSSSQSPQKEPMYSNQDQANMPQSAVKPKRKAPRAPAQPYCLLEAEISCLSLDTVCSQPSNASISSGSHHSIKAEIIRCKKYFGRWKKHFQSKKSVTDVESSLEAKEEKALEVAATVKKSSPSVNKVEGAKSLCEDVSTPKRGKKGKKGKTASLPDHLKGDESSKPISDKDDVPAPSGRLAVVAKAMNEASCTVVQEEVKMKPAGSHISFSIPEDVDDRAKSQQQVSGDVEKKVSLASTEMSGTGAASTSSDSDSDDDSYMKSMIENIKASDVKMICSENTNSPGRFQSKLFAPSPALSTTREVANVEQEEALLEEAVKPNHFVPLDEIAKKHLALKKSHFKINRHSSIKEMETENESKVTTVLGPGAESFPVNLQLLPDVKRNESGIKWNQVKNSWVDKEIYGSNKSEVCPLLSDDDDDQFTSCRDDFQSNASAPKLDILNTVEELEALDKKPTVKKHSSSKGKHAANDKKEFYKVAFLESSSSAEEEYETTQETVHPGKIVEEPNLGDEDNKLFDQEKLSFLSQHLIKKHVLQADKPLDFSSQIKDDILIPSGDLIAGDSNKVTLNEKCECLGDDCVKNNCTEEEEDDEKTTVDGGSDSESCAGVSHKEARSASVDLPVKKMKFPAKKSPQTVKVAMSDGPGRIPTEAMPESWQDDNMKNGYDIVTVYTEDLSSAPQVRLDSAAKQKGHAAQITADIVTGIPTSEVHNIGETINGSAAVTVNVCLNNDTSPLLARPWSEKGKDILSGASSDSDTSTFTNQPKFRGPKSQDKLTRSGSEESMHKLNRAGSLEERSLVSRKAAESVYYMKNDKWVKEDTDLGSLSNSSVSIVTANETLMKDDSDPSVSMASNRWNLRGLMSMLMPVTVQTLASHTKSYINSYLSSNKPSEKDAIEIQKIIAENLSKEDYYNLIGKSRDSSVDISINLDEINGMPDDTLRTAHEDLMSFSSVAKLGDASEQMSFSVDKPHIDPDVTPQISEHSFRDVTLTNSVPETGMPKIEQQKVDSSDLDILEQHFQTVLLDIVSKGSTQLKKNKIAAVKNPKSPSTPMNSENLDNEQVRGISSHGSGLNSEGTDKESSYLLHDAMLSRLQMSLPLLSKSQGKIDSGVISDDSSMDNALSWTFSKESLVSKSPADNELQQGQPGPEDGKGNPEKKKKKSKVQSPPLDSTLHKSLATRRDALKCSGEDDECPNSSHEDSDHCTHASLASTDSTHSTIFLGQTYDPRYDLVSRSSGERDQCTGSAHAKSSSTSHCYKVQSPHGLHDAAEINYDSNMSLAEESPPSNRSMGSGEALVVMDFKNLFSQYEGFCDPDAPVHCADTVEVSAKTVGPYDAQSVGTEENKSDLKHEMFKICSAGEEEKFSENEKQHESQHECRIGDTDCIHCLFGDESRGGEDELKDFGSGDDKDSEDLFNGWGHDNADRCECHDVMAEEEVWMEHTVGQQVCPELPLGTLVLQPGWMDICRVDLDHERVTSLGDIHNVKQDFHIEAVSNLEERIEGNSVPDQEGLYEKLKKDRKVRFSSFVEVCSEAELDERMQEDGVASLTVYRDTLKDCDDEDVGDGDCDSPDSNLRPEREEAWHSQDNCTAVLEESWDNRGMYDLIHSEQFVNSQYVSDEPSFYRQSCVMRSRDKIKARRAQFFCSDITAGTPSECETYSLPVWPPFEATDQLDELDILVRIQPVSLMPRELKNGMSLLDEELMTIAEGQGYNLQRSSAPALSLLLNGYGCLFSFDKPVSGSFDEESEDRKGLEKVDIFNAYNRCGLEISDVNCNEAQSPEEDDKLNAMCEANAQSNLNSSSLDLGDCKSLNEGLATSQCGDSAKVSQSQESLNEENVGCQEVALTQCQKFFSCTCQNVVCLGCCPPSSHYAKEGGNLYVPNKFTMSLEDALLLYQDTYHVDSSTIINQIDSQESKAATHESERPDRSIKAEPSHVDESERLCDRRSEQATDAGLNSAISGMNFECLETNMAPVEKQYYEDFINKCPSIELSLLIPEYTAMEENLLSKEGDEVKVDETEIGFLQSIDTGREDHDTNQLSVLGDCRMWENCLKFPLTLTDKGTQDCNELAEYSSGVSLDGALVEQQGMCDLLKQEASLSMNEGDSRNSDTCLFSLEHCEHNHSQLMRRNLTGSDNVESVDMVSAGSGEFFSVISHPASTSLRRNASLENDGQNVTQVVDEDLSQSSKSASSAENYVLFMPAIVDVSSEGCTEMPSELPALNSSLESPLSSGSEVTPVFPPTSYVLYKQRLDDHQDSTEKIVGEFSSVGSSVDDIAMDYFDGDAGFSG